MSDINTDLIVDVHKVIRNADLGNDLPYHFLELFLEMIHDRASYGWTPTQLEPVVSRILHDLKIIEKVSHRPATWTVSEDNFDGPTMFMSAVRQALVELNKMVLDIASELHQQHGGLQQRDFKELMAKISNCVDKTALMALHEQFAKTHAQQLGSAMTPVSEFIKELIGYINKAIGD
jgi:hypothetical protein